MRNDELASYRRWLRCSRNIEKAQEKQDLQDSIEESLKDSQGFQTDALVNGVPKPLVATRDETDKCSVTMIPGDTIYIGDLVYVFKEYWICVEMYVDEYGMRYAELWMCNQIFHYQDHNLNTIAKYAILDDGSYSKGTDRALSVPENSFVCYISLDDESRALYIDKRLSISVIYDSNGKPVLEVGKITWIDIKSRNFGEGSHLMLFGVKDDPFHPGDDDIEKMICDYKPKEEEPSKEEEEPDVIGYLSIVGRKSMRIGSGRVYSLAAVSYNGENIEITDPVEWSLEGAPKGVVIEPSGTSCKVSVAEDDDLSGSDFSLKCVSPSGKYTEAIFNVEVV